MEGCVQCGEPSVVIMNGNPCCMACMACTTYPGPKGNPGSATYNAVRNEFKNQFEAIAAKREREVEKEVENAKIKKNKFHHKSASQHMFELTAGFFSGQPDSPLAQAWKLWSKGEGEGEDFVAHCNEKL